ncbi:MAG: sigma-70 family RNA polymerase sigma factor [Chitinophagaceae bacterium]|nr:sigma-70 family RNA polymerase sigma factor [Chitinophagaceae bacterium]
MRLLLDEERMLVDCACQGDTDAFSSLVRKYSNAVYSTAFHILDDFHLAQDIAQEAFVKAWHNLNHLEERGKFGSWLFTITKRLSIDWIRKMNKPITTLKAIDHIAEPMSTEEAIEIRERAKTVRSALNSLDEKYRQVIILSFMGGLNTREISKFLNISLSATESRLRRAKEKLKLELISLIEETLTNNKLDESFERRVLERLQGVVVVYIPAIDLAQSAEWYGKFLGYKITHKGDVWSLERPGYLKIILCEIGCNTHPIQFKRSDDTTAVMMIGSPDIEEYHEFLKQKGVKVTNILDRGGCGKSFQMRDPSGNRVMVDYFAPAL